MQLFESAPARAARADRRSTGTSSPSGCGEAHPRSLAAAAPLGRPRASARGLRAWRESVWAPVLGKAIAVFSGMLALAAIGAASLSRGAGVPLPSAAAGPRLAVAGVTPVTAAESGPGSAPGDEPSDAGPAPREKASPGVTADGKVILNRADASELRRLPGVGAKRAEAILLLRQKLGGRFKRVSDLLRVKGIGPKGLKKLEPHVVLDEPKPS